MQTSDVNLRLKPDLRTRMDKEVIRRVRSAQAGCKDRDKTLAYYASMVNGTSQPFSGNQPLQNTNSYSYIVDPMTEDQITGMKAWMSQAIADSAPHCIITAVHPDDVEIAANIEAAYSAKLDQWRIDTIFLDVIHNVVCYPFAPLRIDWEQRVVRQREMTPYDPFTGLRIDPQQKALEEQQAQEQPPLPGEDVGEVEPVEKPTVETKVVWDGPAIMAIAPDHFYLYPSECQSVDDAQQIVEMIFLTQEDLYLGIKKFGYDKKAVMELLRQGPNYYTGSEDDSRRVKNEEDGIAETTGRDGYYQCAVVVGRMPLLWDGDEVATPEEYLEEDFVWLCCPGPDIVFKFGSAAYPFRTYDVAHMDKYPNRLMGQCVTSKLQVIQEEMTAFCRTMMNTAEFTAQPVTLRHISQRNDNAGGEIFPGADIWWSGQIKPEPFEWDKSGVEIIANLVQYWDQRGKELIGAGQGVTQPTEHDTTATEISAVDQASIVRRDLFLTTFLNTLDRVYMLICMMWFSGMSDDGETVITPNGPIEITKEAVADRFIFRANANRQAGNEQARLARTAAQQQVQIQFLGSLQSFPPQYWPMLYHSARALLQQMDVRDVEGWIGKEPSGIDPATMLSQVMQLLQQAAAAGDQAAVQIMTVVQQGLSQQAGGAQGLPPGQPQAGGGVQEGPGSSLPVDVGPRQLVASQGTPYQNGVG